MKLLTPRYDATLTVLADGSLLVVGGQTGQPGVTTRPVLTTEILRPEGGVSPGPAPAGPPRPPVPGAAVVPLANGGALAAGGHDGRYQARAWRFADGQWTPIAPLARARGETAGVELADGRVLVCGGYGNDGEPSPYARVEIWDPRTDRWSEGPAMPEGRRRHQVFRMPDGRVFVLGGVYQGKDLELDAAATTWKVLKTERAGEPTQLPDGRIVDFPWIFDGTKWTELKTKLKHRSAMAIGAFPDGRLVLAGGIDWVKRVGTPTDEVVVLDVAPAPAKKPPPARPLVSGGAEIVGKKKGTLAAPKKIVAALDRKGWDEEGRHALAISPDGKLVACGGEDRIVRVVDGDVKTLRWELPTGKMVWSLAFSPDGERLAIGDWAGSLWLADAKTGKLVLERAGLDGIIPSRMAFDPTGKKLLVGHGVPGEGEPPFAEDQAAAVIVGIPSGKILKELAGPTKAVTGVAWWDGEPVLASEDGTVRWGKKIVDLSGTGDHPTELALEKKEPVVATRKGLLLRLR